MRISGVQSTATKAWLRPWGMALLWSVVLALLTAVQAPVFAQDEGDEPTFSERFVAIAAAVDETEAALEDVEDPDTLSELRLQLQQASGQIVNLKSDIQDARTQLDSDIAVLGDPPEEGDEPEATAELRAEYNERRGELDSLTVRANELENRVRNLRNNSADQLRELLVNRLFDRATPPIFPEQLGEAGEELSQGWKGISTEFGQWVEGHREDQLLHRALVELVILALVVLGLSAFVRNRLAGRVWDAMPENVRAGAGVSAIAFLRASLRIAVTVIAVFIVVRIVLDIGLVEEQNAERLIRAADAVFLVLAMISVSVAIFEPRRAEWRLAEVSDYTGARVHRAAKAFGLLLILDQFFIAIWGGDFFLNTIVRLETIVLTVLFTLIAVALSRSLSANRGPVRSALADGAEATGLSNNSGEESELQGPPESRTLTWFFTRLAVWPAAFSVILSVVGFSALARFVLGKFILLTVLAGVLYIVRRFLRDWATYLVERFITRKAPQGDKVDDLVGFWTRAAIDVLLVLVAIPLALEVLGLQSSEIRAIFLRIFGGFSIGDVQISLFSVLQAVFWFVVILTLTRIGQRFLSKEVLPRTQLSSGAQHSAKTIVGYVGLVLAFFIGVSALGIDLTSLALVASALSVGIGFGLQGVVNNFVSGLILLFERPIKIGDWVMTSAGEGTVKRIDVRSTEIETFDMCTIIVPNSDLITSPVQNWTHRNLKSRVVIPVGVSYNTNLEQAREVLLSVVKDEPEIASHPETYVYFAGYGDSSVDLELRTYIYDANKMLGVRNRLRFKIFDALREAGIEIPFPQRDLHIRSEPAKQQPVQQSSSTGENVPEPPPGPESDGEGATNGNGDSS